MPAGSAHALAAVQFAVSAFWKGFNQKLTKNEKSWWDIVRFDFYTIVYNIKTLHKLQVRQNSNLKQLMRISI